MTGYENLLRDKGIIWNQIDETIRYKPNTNLEGVIIGTVRALEKHFPEMIVDYSDSFGAYVKDPEGSGEIDFHKKTLSDIVEILDSGLLTGIYAKDREKRHFGVEINFNNFAEIFAEIKPIVVSARIRKRFFRPSVTVEMQPDNDYNKKFLLEVINDIKRSVDASIGLSEASKYIERSKQTHQTR